MLNRVCLTGRLTKDPELRKTNSGISVMQFQVATDRRFKRDGEPDADFISVVAWKQSADYIAQYAHKGDTLAIDGRLQTRTYDRNDGGKATVTEVIIDNVQICSSKQKAESNNNSAGQQYSAPQQNYSQSYPQNTYNRPQNNYQAQNTYNPSYEQDAQVTISSDELPF